MFNWKTLGKNAAKVTLTAVLSFLGTLGIMLLMGVVLSAFSVYYLSDLDWYYPTNGGIVAFAECLILGFILASKRAITMATVKALSLLRLGRAAVRLVFERMLKIQATEPIGERGHAVARTVEKLPLAQAQRYAQQAISSLAKVPVEGGGAGGWLKRLIQKRVLWAVEILTLARFREEDAAHGGVDLAKVQADLEERIDASIIRKLKHGVNFWTLLVLIGVPIQVVGMVIAAVMIFTRNH